MRSVAWVVKVVVTSMCFWLAGAQAANLGAQGHLEANEQHERLLLLNQGDYVEGSWQQDDAVSVRLFDAQGVLWRDLSLPSEREGEFAFVVPADGEYRLRLTGQGNYMWTISQVVPLSAQQEQLDEPLQSDLIRQWQRRLQTGESTAAFWAHVAQVGTPLIERLSNTHDRVTFVWRGARQRVQMRGGPSLMDGGQMQQLGDSDIWYITYDLPRDAVFSYQFAPDVPQGVDSRMAWRAALQADPHNSHRLYPQVRDNFRNRSVLSLDRAAQPLLGDEPSAILPQGTLEAFDFNSVILENQRKVRIYTPKLADGQQVEHVMVLLDGEDYLNIVNVPAVVDHLIQAGKIAPVKLVLVGNPSVQVRGQELPPHNGDFVDFIDQELLPWMAEHGVKASPENTIIAGSSYGGLAALNLGLQLPQHFGKVLSMSGSFWWGRPHEQAQWLVRQFVEQDKVPLDIFMSAGLYEDNRGSQGVTLLRANRHMYDVLRAKDYSVKYVESPTAHGYISWERLLPQALEHFLAPKKTADDQEAPAEISRN
ncbi:alpha/beta hydrolase-fold protein [Alcaligenes endophyticus]|uniref:DUF3327 domain-containing protein n=1 Tax=Alcaligenes endophyticus TaxID=1929088 RepID=A0ABT8EM36_9BURK|nr:alpha/beta hydrolase-fold protein [Alcaligenes endophyticus]MCX5591272.1 alpha/beta hydrolase-fold protein [Alcaligenes endophyticus]MDN4122150.1 DUF3327 domain-containing protein [Alcaligenes endophyticus]